MRAAGALSYVLEDVYIILHGCHVTGVCGDDLGIAGSFALGGPFSAVNHVWCQMNSSPPFWCVCVLLRCFSLVWNRNLSARHKGLQIIQWAVARARRFLYFCIRNTPSWGCNLLSLSFRLVCFKNGRLASVYASALREFNLGQLRGNMRIQK